MGEAGIFMEAGKREVWSRERVLASAPTAGHYAIAIDVDMTRKQQGMVGALSLLANRAGLIVLSLPLRSFDLVNQAEQAFRMLQGGLNLGKVVLRVSPWNLAAKGRHLILGGTRGLGLLTGRWLAQRGASTVALASRCDFVEFAK